MKIIFVSHYAKFYGANRALLQMIQGLKESGVTPLVIIPAEGPVVEKLRESGIPFRIVPFRLTMCKHPRLIDSVKRHLQNRRLARRLANELAGEKADVIHSNSIATNFGHLLA
ncbi:MAG: glycosyltransferase, partial [Acidobacteriia bacterium]|nr:glycosyltransferase [Terriglobia bacterium]